MKGIKIKNNEKVFTRAKEKGYNTLNFSDKLINYKEIRWLFLNNKCMTINACFTEEEFNQSKYTEISQEEFVNE